MLLIRMMYAVPSAKILPKFGKLRIRKRAFACTIIMFLEARSVPAQYGSLL